jgi:hypothetical protein
MPQMITLGYKELMAEAEAEIVHVTAADVIAMLGEDVSSSTSAIRANCRRRAHPGSTAPRGMLEFWVDPKALYRPIFAEDKTFVIHCAGGVDAGKSCSAWVEAGDGRLQPGKRAGRLKRSRQNEQAAPGDRQQELFVVVDACTPMSMAAAVQRRGPLDRPRDQGGDCHTARQAGRGVHRQVTVGALAILEHWRKHFRRTLVASWRGGAGYGALDRQ